MGTAKALVKDSLGHWWLICAPYGRHKGTLVSGRRGFLASSQQEPMGG